MSSLDVSLIPFPLRVTQSFTLQAAQNTEHSRLIERLADWKSAIQQSETLRWSLAMDFNSYSGMRLKPKRPEVFEGSCQSYQGTRSRINERG